MSASLVRKSLCIVDPDFNKSEDKQNKIKEVKNDADFTPINRKSTGKFHKGKRAQKVNLQKSSKLTLAEARQRIRSKEQILERNLQKLKLIKEVCSVDLDENLTRQIFERARSRRPVKAKGKSKEEKRTAFTEEDFRRFEAEYFDE